MFFSVVLVFILDFFMQCTSACVHFMKFVFQILKFDFSWGAQIWMFLSNKRLGTENVYILNEE